VGSAAGHSGGGDCTVCHTTEASGSHETAAYHTATTVGATAGGGCVSCHVGNPVSDMNGTAVHTNCLACHLGLNTSQLHILQGSATSRTGMTDNTCTDCHTAVGSSFNNHSTSSHALRVTSTGTTCVTASCHPGDPIFNIHLNATAGYCVDCHSTTDWRLVGSAAGKGTGKPATTGNNCKDCHADPKYDNNPHQ